MSRCPSCARPVDSTHRYCPLCGSSTDVAESPTGTAPRGRPASSTATPTPARSGSSGAGGVSGVAGDGRFVAGTLLGGRYRVVGLLGKGGMGEVYRADDLRLEQTVALKFLPESLQHDRERLERFYNEVRVARQVSHPAVCRVYDVGEADGLHFLSMEFVDGENLASLLRRIGRLPPDKALEIARQLCAGLAAAHAKGVLHRDVKPANVMLDGRGHARIMDFGLAGVMASFEGAEVRSGTPAYMSPEQLEGREVTTRSEVYSLGLVLYELFTGRKAFEARSRADLLRAQRDDVPVHPSNLVPELDPAVERAILRCLEKEPARRPTSALALAALLPGGDPLAAALAAGETPSLELVAAAGECEGLGRVQAWGVLLALLAGLLAMPFLARRLQAHHRVSADRPPLVLEDRARELLRSLGAESAPRDSAVGFGVDSEALVWTRAHDPSPRRWGNFVEDRPALLQFWYRQSPQPLVALRDMRAAWADPTLVVADMAGVRLDLRGRLLSLYRVPPQVEQPRAPDAPADPAPDWGPLFAAAQLDATTLRPVTPLWTPPFYCDRRAAWEGAYPGRPDLPLRVEGASYRGRVVAFFLVSPWTRPERAQPRAPSRVERAGKVMVLVLFGALVALGALLARRNDGRGRSDRRGAARVAGFTLITSLAALLLGAGHVPDTLGEVELLARGAGPAFLRVAILWLFYLALEPYARRLWPRTLVGWARLLGGGLRDPVVGRDVLLGSAWGVALAVTLSLTLLVPAWLAGVPAEPRVTRLWVTLGSTLWAAETLKFLLDGVALSLAALLLLSLLRLLLRREHWAASALALLLAGVNTSMNFENVGWLAVPIGLGVMTAYVLMLVRFGLLAVSVGLTVTNLLAALPLTPDPSAWHAQPTLLSLALVSALAAYGLRTALGGTRPLASPAGCTT